MKNIENFVYLSQIDSHDIFLYWDDTIHVIDWLIENGHVIQSWETFLETKKGITRTLNYGFKTDSPIRSFGKDIETIKKEIESAIEDWSRRSNNSRLIICLNFKKVLVPKVHFISAWSRTAAGILGFLSLGVLGMLAFAYFNSQISAENSIGPGLISALICTPIFLYAAFTGRGDLRFLSPENFFKRLRKRKIVTETGQLRWPQNA